MKIKSEHYIIMIDAIAKISESINMPSYLESLREDPRVKDPLKRFRWDLMSSAVGSRWICDNLYSYANDDHIDTALRRIVWDLGLDTVR
jgi:hypothetical protein